jgi:hypothetical protein
MRQPAGEQRDAAVSLCSPAVFLASLGFVSMKLGIIS